MLLIFTTSNEDEMFLTYTFSHWIFNIDNSECGYNGEIYTHSKQQRDQDPEILQVCFLWHMAETLNSKQINASVDKYMKHH